VKLDAPSTATKISACRASPFAPSTTVIVLPAKSTNKRSPAGCTWRSVGFSRPAHSRYRSQNQE